jgi:Lon protease-like protein
MNQIALTRHQKSYIYYHEQLCELLGYDPKAKSQLLEANQQKQTIKDRLEQTKNRKKEQAKEKKISLIDADETLADLKN